MIRHAVVAIAVCIGSAHAVRAAPADLRSTEAWIDAEIATGAISGAAVATVDGEQVRSRGYGRRAPSDGAAPGPDTPFQIGSVTKVFTHLLLAELAQAGSVRYDQAIGTLLPEDFEPANPRVAAIELQSLATHTSGLPRLPANLPLTDSVDPYGGYGVADLVAGLAGARAKQPLGSFYTYSNFGVGVLGHLLGRVDGRGYQRAVTAHVIAPLRLQHTAFAGSDAAAVAVSGGKQVPAWTFQDSMHGAGALWSSVSDLARLLQAYLGTHEHALRHDLQRDLVVAHADAGPFAVTRVWHVARAGARPIYWHNGGTAGFHSFVGFRPDRMRGIAILVSGDADPTDTGLRALGATPPAKPAAVRHDAGVLGQYRFSDSFGIGVYAQDGALLAQATGQPAFALHALGDDWYALGEVDASLHFVRDDAGAVVRLELAQNGALQPAPKVAAIAATAARQAIEVDAATLAEYAGAYAFAPQAVLTVRAAGAGLEAQLTGQPFLPIYASAKDRFFYKVVDAQLRFERDAAGVVAAVVLLQGGVEQRAARQR